MQYCFDIDGTICTNRDTMRKEKNDPSIEYTDMEPFMDRIEQINQLYDQGHTITMWTGRGCRTHNGNPEYWKPATAKQLEEWGVKHHNLIVGQKPWFDTYICDKSHNSEVWFNIHKTINTVE